MSKLGEWASKATRWADNALFKTDDINRARTHMTDPKFQSFMSEAEAANALDIDDLKDSGKHDKKLGQLYVAFEQKESVTKRTKELLLKKISSELGMNESELDAAALGSIDAYFEKTTFEDPKMIERFAKAFAKGEKLEKKIGASRKRLNDLVTRFGPERYDLMKAYKSSWMPFGNTETRAWAKEEARDRGYGPLRSWLFTTFSANSAAKEEIQKGSGMSWERMQEVYGHTTKAEKGLGKLEGKFEDKVVSTMLGTTELVQQVLENAQKNSLARARLVMEDPKSSVEQIQAERARLAKMESSEISATEFTMLDEKGKDKQVCLEDFQAAFDCAMDTRLRDGFEKLITKLETTDIPFATLKSRVDKRVEQLATEGVESLESARHRIAQIMSKADMKALTKSKQIMLGMIINDLMR